MKNNDYTTTRDEYIATRVNDQIIWYSRKAAMNKQWHFRSRTIVIIGSSLIPLLVGYSEGDWAILKYFAGFLGVVVAITEGITSVKKYRENWNTYRLTAEALIREKVLFENRIGDNYATNDENAFKQFVIKAEQIMAVENQEWRANLESQTSA